MHPSAQLTPEVSDAELLREYTQHQEETRRCTVALASAAHELKTPLSIMCGYLELLMSEKLGPLSERQRRVLKAMQTSGTRLQQFIAEFLAYTASLDDKLVVRLESGDLHACLHELHEIWLARYQEKGVALYFVVMSALARFRFDYHKVQRVVSILLENAHASTPRGGAVWLTAEPHVWERRVHQASREPERRRRACTEANAARVTVVDTGPGIAPEFHQDIFEDFVSLRPHGTGLGLAIARRLVQAQQGKIWVESEPGRGSRFSVLLPLQPS